MASSALRKLFRDVRLSPVGHCVSPSVPYAMRSAAILRKWEALESIGCVRLRCESDDDYEAMQDDPDDVEAYGSIGEFTIDDDPSDSSEWAHADSCWGHTGYRDVLDWRENVYILDIMGATIDAFRDAWKSEVRRRCEVKAGLCPTCHGTGRAA